MAKHSVAGRSTVVPTNLRAGFSIFSAASYTGVIREIGVYSTVNTHCTLALARFSSATNVGAGLMETQWGLHKPPTNMTVFAGHTGDGGPWAVTSYSYIRQAMLPAAIGGGHVWPFGDEGLTCPIGATNGFGVVCSTGTGQIFDFYIDFDDG